MAENKPELKTIWYFVGLILIVMGGLVLLSGIVQLFSPEQPTVLAETYPAIWWGAIMLVVGFIYYISNRKKVVE